MPLSKGDPGERKWSTLENSESAYIVKYFLRIFPQKSGYITR